MTVPEERTRAVLQAREFLRDLVDRERTPDVPQAVRDEARRLLRHYPDAMHLRFAAHFAPQWWGRPESPTLRSPKVQKLVEP